MQQHDQALPTGGLAGGSIAGPVEPARAAVDDARPGGHNLTHRTLLGVFLSFALFAAWRAPVPGVNEPHYLCKAKHLFAPEWCGRDLFLSSADVHLVFLAFFGGVTRVLTLEEAAWLGRVLAWLALAWGWMRLAQELLSSAVAAICSAWFFLALVSLGSLSGEWLLGGVEAKVFAYGCLFLALAHACGGRWNRAGIWSGVSISLHPVVGAWGSIALALAWVSTQVWPIRHRSVALPCGGAAPWRPASAREAASAAALAVLFALPGLIPAAAVLAAAASPEVSRRAAEIQVFDRLSHHLDPLRFRPSAWLHYLLLLASWLGLMRLAAKLGAAGEAIDRNYFFARFVLVTALIAGVGVVVGGLIRAPALMKFYPFRLFDVLLPAAAALTLTRVWSDVQRRLRGAARSPRNALLRGAAGCAPFLALAAAFAAPVTAANPGGLTAAQRDDWRNACNFVKQRLPYDSLILTPHRGNFGFKWYAERAEYVAYKDCPQDAASLVEWQRRLDRVRAWRTAHYATDGFTPEAVAELRRQMGIDFIVAWTGDPYRYAPVFRNASFAVYASFAPPARERSSRRRLKNAASAARSAAPGTANSVSAADRPHDD